MKVSTANANEMFHQVQKVLYGHALLHIVDIDVSICGESHDCDLAKEQAHSG